mgnify:CR=1 FL=1
MQVALYSRKVSKTNLPYIVELLNQFKRMGWKPVLEKEFKKQLVKKIGLDTSTLEFTSHKDFVSGIDMVVSLGGDGTFIQSVNYIRDSQVPIIGINTGRLGFLANVSKESIHDAFEKLQRKQFDYQKPNGKIKKIKTVGDKWATFQTVNFNTASQPFYVLLSPDLEMLNSPKEYTDKADYLQWLQTGLVNLNR